MSEVCSNFTQHQWKKELCSNCLNPRNKHSSPVPAKRPVKSPKGDPENGSNGTADESGGWPPGMGRQKPEARVKPTIAAKPGSPAKPAMIGAKPSSAPKAVVKPQQLVNDGAYDDVPHPVPIPKNANPPAPYYSEYDVSYKGQSGAPFPIGVGTHVRNKSIDRLKNDIEIVMPYNVVDVSTDPPISDPQLALGKNGTTSKVKSPLAKGDIPGSPNSTAQRREGGSPQFRRNIRILESAMHGAAGDAPEMCVGASPGSPGPKDDQSRTKKSPFQSPNLGRKPLVPGVDLYEDVEDPEDAPQEFVRNTPARTSSMKSSVFEAKLSTIAQNLDLNKKTTGKPASMTPPQQHGSGSKGPAPHPNEPPMPNLLSKKDRKKAEEDAKRRQSLKAKEEARTEKQRKGSVGKSFFKKLFSRSGGDSEDSDAVHELSLSLDSDATSSKADDASSTKSSTPGSVEGSPLLSNVRHTIDIGDKKENLGKKVARAESAKEPAMFNAELRQALARGSKMGEKNIGTVGRLKDPKREGNITHDAAFAALKGSPLFERRFQQRTYETVDGDDGSEPPPKPARAEVNLAKTEPKHSDPTSMPASVMGPGPKKRISTAVDIPEPPPMPPVAPVPPLAPPPSVAPDPQPAANLQTIPTRDIGHHQPLHKEAKHPPPQVAAKPEKPKPETTRKPEKHKPEVSMPVKQTQEVVLKSEHKPIMLVESGTCKRRPAPAAPPPPAPMDAPANRRSTTCTSPVSPRPTGPPPELPPHPPDLPPPPPNPQEAPPMLPEKKKRDSLKAEEMEIYGKKIDAAMHVTRPETCIPINVQQPAVVPPPKLDGPPLLPEKMKKRKDGDKLSGISEVYSKRPQISAPTLQRTSAVLDVTVEAGLGASMPEPPTVPKSSPQTTSPSSTSPQSTLNTDRKPRPRSEISTNKSGTLRRKPDGAPPPPPLHEGNRRMSAADVSPQDDHSHTKRRLSHGSAETMVVKSQSLPRGGVQHCHEVQSGGTLGRNQHQRPSVRQTGRAATMSDVVTSSQVETSKHETLMDITNEINKFSQRKLPSPPREEAGSLPENDYEMVQDDDEPPPQSAGVGAHPAASSRGKPASQAVCGLMERNRRDRSATPYEDVTDEDYDDMDFTGPPPGVLRAAAAAAASAATSALSGHDGSPLGGKMNGEPKVMGRRQNLDPTQNPTMTSSAEYLQPVLHDHSPEDECLRPSTGDQNMIGQPMAGVPLVMNLSGNGGSYFDGVGGVHQHQHQQQQQQHQQQQHQQQQQQQQQEPSYPYHLLHQRGEPPPPAPSDDDDWRPNPIPRRKGSPTSSSNSYVVLYNDDSGSDSSRSSGFNPAEGWFRLSQLQASTLEQIRSSLDSMFIGAPVGPNQNLRWDDFILESFVPVYCNVGIAFYRATTNRLQIRECLLMLSVRTLPKELSLHPLPTEVAIQPHLGILHPSALYQDLVSATLFPEVTSDPRVYGQCGKVPTTVWVLPFASVCNFQEYCIGLRGLYATKLPIYHRYLCSAVQQALSAILYLLNKGCGLQCFQADEILGVTPDNEQEPFVLVLPHHCHVGTPTPTVSNNPFVIEMGQLLMRLLDDRKLASACGVSLSQSRFFRGLYMVARMLNRNTTPTLFKAQLMCEFMLWGPGEQDLRSILTSHNPQASLDVWLQLERSRMIGRYAIEDFVATKEDAHRVHFLVSATDQTLWDTAQLLQQES